MSRGSDRRSAKFLEENDHNGGTGEKRDPGQDIHEAVESFGARRCEDSLPVLGDKIVENGLTAHSPADHDTHLIPHLLSNGGVVLGYGLRPAAGSDQVIFDIPDQGGISIVVLTRRRQSSPKAERQYNANDKCLQMSH